MKKLFGGISLSLIVMFILSGCATIGDKSASMSIIYGATALLALLLLIGYCCLMQKKDIWFLLLFSATFVINAGYFSLSVSKTLEEALLANRISYLGSVFMPLSMLMIILNVSKLNYKKFVPALLLVISLATFFVAASPGYLNIYYESVTLETINGVSVLDKVYGPWHCMYLFYLLLYFAVMIAIIIHATIKKKLESSIHAVILVIAVFVNIGVWLLEQLVRIDFEFLSVSYIISEFFLLSLYLMIQENSKNSSVASISVENHTSIPETVTVPDTKPTEVSQSFDEQCEFLSAHLYELTQTERLIYNLYLEGKTTKEIMQELSIKENTLKYHNKNIYSKLGVSSRKQLIEISKAISKNTRS